MVGCLIACLCETFLVVGKPATVKMLPFISLFVRGVLVIFIMCILKPDTKTLVVGDDYDYDYDFDYDYDYSVFSWRHQKIPPSFPDYTCFYYERIMEKKFDPVCYQPDATAFPGVSWQQLKENWHYWSEYPCIYYTEEAFLAATNDNISQTDVQCDYRHYYFSDGVWTSNRYRTNFRSVLLDVVDLDSKLRSFFAKRDNQGSFSFSFFEFKGHQIHY